MRRTLFLAIIVLVLGGVTYFLLRSEQQGPVSTVVGADREFRVDSSQVGRIFIADRYGNTTNLQRTRTGWTYNGDNRARPDAVENLLQAVHRIEMQFKPPNAAVPAMVESLATEGLKVELYDRQGALLKTYYVGGSTPDERGTYFLLEGYEQPYVVGIPGWEGNVRFRYNLLGDDWRDRAVFRAGVDNIATVTVEYPKQQNRSFRLSRRGRDYTITPFYELTPRINRPLKPGIGESYLVNFRELLATDFANQNRNRDSIVQQIPFANITLTTNAGEVQSVTLFPIYRDAYVDEKTGNLVTPESVQGYYALTGKGDFMVVQDLVFRKILWSYDFFFL
jgi:hypothetical protein